MGEGRMTGKRIGGAVYVHRSALREIPAEVLNPALAKLVAVAPAFRFDVVKWAKKTGAVTFTACPDFDRCPWPAVGDSYRVEGGLIYRRPARGEIYHQKETMVGPDYRGFDLGRAREATAAYRALGLPPSKIGRAAYWDEHARPHLTRFYEE